MSLPSHIKQLFSLAFTGGSNGDDHFLICYNQQNNEIKVTDNDGNTISAGVAGDPPSNHNGNYSTYYQCLGSIGIRFLGNNTAYPFATLEREANYSNCPLNLNTIRIKLPVKITPDDGSNSGAITVETQNARSTVSYKLNSGSWQGSGTFTNLSAGTYNITATDGQGIDIVELKVHSSYSYATKYRLQYYDIHGIQTIVNIKKKNYTGSIIDLTGTGNPVVFNYPGSDEKLNPIFGSEVKLNLKSISNYQFIEFSENDNREYLIEYTKGGNTQFKGYVMPDNYIEKYGPPPYNLTVSATCGLATLKNIKFLDRNGNRLYGRFKTIEIIQFILNYLDLNLDIYTAFNIYEDSMNSSVSMLSQLYKDIDNYYENDNIPSCYDVLSKIMKEFTGRIFQSDGHFKAININLMPLSFAWFIYHADGSTSTQTTNLKIYNDGANLYSAYSFVFIKNDASLEILPGYKKITSKFNTGYKSLIGCDFTDKNQWKSNSELYRWSGNATINKSNTGNNSSDIALKIEGYAYNFNNCDYIQTIVEEVETTNNNLEFIFNVRINAMDTSDDPAGFIYVALELIGNNGIYYAYDYNTNNWEDVETTQTPYLMFKPSTLGQWEEIRQLINSIPTNGDLILKLCQYKNFLGSTDSTTDIEFKNVNLRQYSNINPIPLKIIEETEIGDYNDVPDDFELLFGDAPDYDNNHIIFKNINRLSNGNPTNSWDGLSYLEKYNNEIKNNFKTPYHLITGSMIGNLKFHNILYDQQNANRYFMLNKFKYNDKSQQSSVEWMEVYMSETATQELLTADQTDITADQDDITADQTVE